MNVAIFIVLVVICVILVRIVIKLTPPLPVESKEEPKVVPPRVFEKDLKELVESMREREQGERDRLLAEYAEKKRKRQPLMNPVVTPVREDRIHTTNPKAEKMLIPENLSEVERQILIDFYNL